MRTLNSMTHLEGHDNGANSVIFEKREKFIKCHHNIAQFQSFLDIFSEHNHVFSINFEFNFVKKIDNQHTSCGFQKF